MQESDDYLSTSVTPYEPTYCDTHPTACGGGGDDDDTGDGSGTGGDDDSANPDDDLRLGSELTNLTSNIFNDYLDAAKYCRGDNPFTNVGCMDFFSLYFQDVATAFSSAGAAVTLFTTVSGCIVGSEAGVLPGCAGGYAVGAFVHYGFFNIVETGTSVISFLATVQSDYLTQDTKVNSWSPNDWRVGEDTITGFFTLLAGTLATEPFLDAGIDTYASGYNHGYFCGISTILDCIP